MLVQGEPGPVCRSMALRLAAGPAIEIDGATACAADVVAAGIGRSETRDTVLITDVHLFGADAAAVLGRLAERHRPRWCSPRRTRAGTRPRSRHAVPSA